MRGRKDVRMAQDFHRRRVAAVGGAEDADAVLVDIRPAPQRLYALGHVVHLGLPELEIDRVELALAHPRSVARESRFSTMNPYSVSALGVWKRSLDVLLADAGPP